MASEQALIDLVPGRKMKAPSGWARRADPNQKEIVTGLRALGIPVKVVSHCPKGVLDLIVGFRGVLYWVEIKSKAKYKLTEPEQKTIDLFQGYPVIIVWTLEQLLEKIGAIDVIADASKIGRASCRERV